MFIYLMSLFYSFFMYYVIIIILLFVYHFYIRNFYNFVNALTHTKTNFFICQRHSCIFILTFFRLGMATWTWMLFYYDNNNNLLYIQVVAHTHTCCPASHKQKDTVPTGFLLNAQKMLFGSLSMHINVWKSVYYYLWCFYELALKKSSLKFGCLVKLQDPVFHALVENTLKD